MIRKLKIKSEFGRNVVTLVTGTAIAQILAIVASPILTRLYTPDDFGILALFISISSVLSIAVCGRYELAIMLPKKDKYAINIFALGFVIACFVSILFLILFTIFNDLFTKLFNNQKISFWLYFIPLFVFFSGLFNLLSYFNNRTKNYIDLKNATIIKSAVIVIVQIGAGFMKIGVSGLIIGMIISSLSANIRLLKNVVKNKILISSISKIKMIALAKKYKNFPKYSIGAHTIETLSGSMHIILFSSFFDASVVGFLFLTERCLNLPISVISGAIARVFFQNASVEYTNHSECVNLYKTLFKKLFLFALIPLVLVFLFAPFVFSVIFGEEWRVAGEYARILSMLYFVRFIHSPLSVMYMIAQKQKIELYWQIYLFVSLAGAISLGYFLSKDVLITLSCFTVAYLIAYIINIILTYSFAKGKLVK